MLPNTRYPVGPAATTTCLPLTLTRRVSPDGTRIAWGDQHFEGRVVTLETGRRTDAMPQDFRYTPGQAQQLDRPLIATLNGGPVVVNLADLSMFSKTGSQLGALASADGTLFGIERDQLLPLGDRSESRPPVVLENPFPPLKGPDLWGGVRVLHGPAGDQVAIIGSDSTTLRIWQAKTGQLVWESPELEAGNRWVAVSDDGRFALEEQWTERSVRRWRVGDKEPLTTHPNPFDRAYNYVLSPTGSRAACGSNLNHYCIFDFESQTATLVPVEADDKGAFGTVGFVGRDRHVLLSHRILDLDDPAHPKVVWRCPERHRFRGALGSSLQSFPLGDDRHVLVTIDNQLQVWDWHANKKRGALLLLPFGEWAFFNTETRCWDGSPLAFQHLRFARRSSDGKDEWLTEREFEKRTGWKNNPGKAPLPLEVFFPAKR